MKTYTELRDISESVKTNEALLGAANGSILLGATKVYECSLLEALKQTPLMRKRCLASMALAWARAIAGCAPATSVESHIHPGLLAALRGAKDANSEEAARSSSAAPSARAGASKKAAQKGPKGRK